MTTLKQASANRENAKCSTGPKSDEGKRVVSANRISHGILSSKLLLEDERAEEFQTLLDDLQLQLKPVGTLELSLVEKIAINLWRQRRLVRAETATIELDSSSVRVASVVDSGMGLGLSWFGNGDIGVEDLKPPNQKQITRCQQIIAECQSVGEGDLEMMHKQAPWLCDQLVSYAEVHQESVEQTLSSCAFRTYINDWMCRCMLELAKLEKQAERFPIITKLAEKAKDSLSVPWDKLDLLSKYQTTLDNQLFKTLKILRETQEWRLKSLDGQIESTSLEVNHETA